MSPGRRWLKLGLIGAIVATTPFLFFVGSAQATSTAGGDPELMALIAQAAAEGVPASDLAGIREASRRLATGGLPLNLGYLDGVGLHNPSQHQAALRLLEDQVRATIQGAALQHRIHGEAILNQADANVQQATDWGLDPDDAGLLRAEMDQDRSLLASDLPSQSAAADAHAREVLADTQRALDSQRAEHDRVEAIAREEELRVAGDIEHLRADVEGALAMSRDELYAARIVQSGMGDTPQSSRSGPASNTGLALHLDALRSAFTPDRTYPDLLQLYGTAVRSELQSRAALAAVAPGKLITVSIGEQVVRAFDGGHEILWSYATTGRPGLETDTGTYHVYAKFSPFVMHSPWPKGSPNWYPDSPITSAMFFNGGDALHDAPWRSNYGPGSNFGLNGEPGTHGCVNLPYPAEQTLFRWAEIGTQVSVY